MGFIMGAVLGAVIAIFFIINSNDNKLDKACQGTPWVIEEPLIKKTLTCVVEIKEKK